jgi:hypothetical protein
VARQFTAQGGKNGLRSTFVESMSLIENAPARRASDPAQTQ